MTLSILHRATGMFLCIGALLLAYWLLMIAAGPAAYAKLAGQIDTWYGLSLVTAFVFSLYFHLCNGVRHLFWDAGYGFEIRTAYLSAWLVIIFSLLLTGLSLFLGMGLG